MNTVDRYLKSLGTVLWGRSFDLLEPDSYEQAKKFIEDLWYALDDIEFAMRDEWLNSHVR
jgi:hypothetical protein